MLLFTRLHIRTFFMGTLLFLSFFFNTTLACAAQNHLMINPVRAIFLERQRTVTVSVGNPTDTPISYGISLVTLRRNAKGILGQVTQETQEEQLSKSLIRFSPRRATIAPHARQVVKLMVRKPGDLPFGEYRTRLQIMPIQDTQHSGTRKEKVTNGRKINLDLLVGLSIPIIIQHGPSDTQVSPDSLTIQAFKQVASGVAAEVTMVRDGVFSGFGDIYLTYTGSDGEKKEIGRSRGIAIYLPETEKRVTVPLTNITKEELATGSIKAAFHAYQGNSKRKKRAQKITFKDFAL